MPAEQLRLDAEPSRELASLLPAPIVERFDDYLVLRDDLLPGGSKRRALVRVLKPGHEYVFASPPFGYAQLALAHAAADVGAKVRLFLAERKQPHELTIAAGEAGAELTFCRPGYYSVLRARAQAYAAERGAEFFPLGIASEETESAMAEVIGEALAQLEDDPPEAWFCVGAGMLARAAARAFPPERLCLVAVGMQLEADAVPRAARIWRAPEPFDRKAEVPPPWPSAEHYDAKMWRFIRARAQPGALVWNVA